MAVLAPLFDSIGEWFERGPRGGGAPDPLKKRVYVRAMLETALATPPAAWSTRKGERQHYNKVAMLPYPLVARPHTSAVLPRADTDPRGHTIAQLRAALEAGLEVVDGAAHGRRRSPPMAHGLRSSALDALSGHFVAERDFLAWLLAHNVSALDLGASTSALLWKGERHARVGQARARPGRTSHV